MRVLWQHHVNTIDSVDANHEVSGRHLQTDSELAPVPTKRNTHGIYDIQGLGLPITWSLSQATYIALILYNHLATSDLFVSYPHKALMLGEGAQRNMNLLDGSKI